jgi:hypothetical protein
MQTKSEAEKESLLASGKYSFATRVCPFASRYCSSGDIRYFARKLFHSVNQTVACFIYTYEGYKTNRMLYCKHHNGASQRRRRKCAELENAKMSFSSLSIIFILRAFKITAYMCFILFKIFAKIGF